jgi:pyruvate kinase
MIRNLNLAKNLSEVAVKDLELMVTLCPTFPHYRRFARDSRLSGIRLNSAMVFGNEVDKEIVAANAVSNGRPLYFDIKGRQLRIQEVHANPNNLEITINHPIDVDTPIPVLFKAGSDVSLLVDIQDHGHKLIFDGGPKWKVKAGESLCIRHPSLEISGPVYCDYEIEKIKKVVAGGFKRFFLSYVEEQRDVDEFMSILGFKPEEVFLKIESKKGLKYVANDYVKKEGISLCTARGDMYVEIDKPHEILKAQKLIIEKDSEALVGSRILLSIVNNAVPECHDFSDLAWLYDIGYKRMMLCDELCLKEQLLGTAINAFDSFRDNYAEDKVEKSKKDGWKWFDKLVNFKYGKKYD